MLKISRPDGATLSKYTNHKSRGWYAAKMQIKAMPEAINCRMTDDYFAESVEPKTKLKKTHPPQKKTSYRFQIT